MNAEIQIVLNVVSKLNDIIATTDDEERDVGQDFLFSLKTTGATWSIYLGSIFITDSEDILRYIDDITQDSLINVISEQTTLTQNVLNKTNRVVKQFTRY